MTVTIRYAPPPRLSPVVAVVFCIVLIVVGLGGFTWGRSYQQRQTDKSEDTAAFSCSQRLDEARDKFDAERRYAENIKEAWFSDARFATEAWQKEHAIVQRLTNRRAWIEPYMKAGTLVIVGRP